MNIAKYIDHTDLRADATKEDIDKLCKEAIDYGFASVCVNGSRVAQARQILNGSGVGVATVVGFPLGAMTDIMKCLEAVEAVKNGASEIDMVINIGALKDKNYEYVEKEIEQIVNTCKVTVKVIIEACKLTDEEKIKACEIAVNAGADYVKTSTGLGGGGATIDDVKLMKAHCGGAKIKAAGGIRDYDTAMAMIDAGASRIGTSAGKSIVEMSKSK